MRVLAGYRNRMVHFYHEMTPEELYASVALSSTLCSLVFVCAFQEPGLNSIPSNGHPWHLGFVLQ